VIFQIVYALKNKYRKEMLLISNRVRLFWQYKNATKTQRPNMPNMGSVQSAITFDTVKFL
jgi:hypothetical protein